MLHFTCRAAHGQLGTGDIHGDLDGIAKEFLSELNPDFYSVFEESKYPILRSNDSIDY